MIDLIKNLNEAQQKTVLDTEGPVLVFAGAGSGKTRVLITRIAHLVLNKNVDPSRILAITFTNKASNEMKSRLEKVFNTSSMWVSTIHKMCVRILRANLQRIGYTENFTIYDETDKEKALKRILDEFELDSDTYLKNINYHISTAKNEYLTPREYLEKNSEYKEIKTIYKVYKRYDEYLKECNALDFDDILVKTYDLLLQDKEVLNYYQEKFLYIHVDEFQDTNRIQFLIIRLLANKYQNIFCVGDDDQSIYGWRGAKIENILNFEKFFPEVTKYKLEQNYRSTKKILNLANKIIKSNEYRNDKSLWTENEEGVKIENYAAVDETNEAFYVASQIKSLVNRYNYKYSDFAVLMRVNALSRVFEQEFNKYSIPYRVYGGFRFYERKEIKDIIAYMKFINNPSDNESFMRIINTPKRGIGDKTLVDLVVFAKSENISAFKALDRIEEIPISNGAKIKLNAFKELIQKLTIIMLSHSVDEFTKQLISLVNFKQMYPETSEENINRCLNIDEFENSVNEFIKLNGKNTTLSDFLNSVTLSTDTDNIKEDETVSIATIHAVKGLEFKCVFIVGLDESIFPISRAMQSQTEMEEERRLMYVAITRAMNRLYITRANSRYLYGNRSNMIASRFYKDCFNTSNSNNNYVAQREENYTKKLNYYNDEDDYVSQNGKGYSSNYINKIFNQQKPKENTNINHSNYKIGIKVKHKKFGVGTIVLIKNEGENLIADVAFTGVGVKSLAVKFAPMEIIDE